MARALPMLLRMMNQDMRRLANHFYEDPFFRMQRGAIAPWITDAAIKQHFDFDEAVPKLGKNGFQVSVDVSEFKPSELTVKVKDDSVVVEGKHEERQENQGFISRQFIRRYVLPKGYDPNKVMSSLSSDGVLTINAPKPPELEDKANERVIPIQQTGPAELNIKENPPEEQNQNQQESSSSDKKKN